MIKKVDFDTIAKEVEQLKAMATLIKSVMDTGINSEGLTGTNYWAGQPERLYQGANDLAIKILLEMIGETADKKIMMTVDHWLEEGNFHYPVEAVLGIGQDITFEGENNIWVPEGKTLLQHYLEEVKRIVDDNEGNN